MERAGNGLNTAIYQADIQRSKYKMNNDNQNKEFSNKLLLIAALAVAFLSVL